MIPRGRAPGLAAFSPQEQDYYQQLFSIADRERRGVVDGVNGAKFLLGSNLPQQILREIWQIADSDNQGELTAEKFFVALRLVAHAQAGRRPSPAFVAEVPQNLPDFPEIRRSRDPSETSPLPGSATPSLIGPPSDISELQPVLAAEEDQVRRAAEISRAEASRGRSESPRRGWSEDQWRPSRRMQRKLADLFLRTDTNKDGFVDQEEAFELLQRSRLDFDALNFLWQLADQDRDGRLSFPEFVILTHMITALTRGAQFQTLQAGVPPDLLSVAATMDPVEVLTAEREASRSRSASPAPTWTGATGFTPTGLDSAPSPQLSFPDMPEELEERKEERKERRRKERPKLEDGFFPGAPPGGGEKAEARAPEPELSAEERRQQREKEESDRRQIQEAKSRFEAVLAADQEITRAIRAEVGQLDEELTQVREVSRQLERQVQHEEREHERAEDERRSLERELASRKQRLGELQEDRRSLNLDVFSRHQDLEHFEQELAFLKKVSAEEENVLNTIKQANAVLQNSYLGLEVQTGRLKQQRVEVAQSLAEEEALKKQEERLTHEARSKLERLRREQAQLAAEAWQTKLRLDQLREMQSAPSTSESGIRVQRGGHSWATAVLREGSEPPGPWGAGPSPQKLAARMVVTREGV